MPEHTPLLWGPLPPDLREQPPWTPGAQARPRPRPVMKALRALFAGQRQTDLVQDSENKVPFKLQSPGG